MNTLVDNDVLVKGACYGVLAELATSVSGIASRCGVLGAARFVAPSAIRRQHLQRDASIARELLQAFLDQTVVVEPTEDEQQLAAELESTAQALALNLDAGESQLAAILVTRTIASMLTGDKRAIVAMEQLLQTIPQVQVLAGRVHCLEQAVRRLVQATDVATIRHAICAEPRVDKALTICFSCASPDSQPAVVAALSSYIDDLRAAAPHVLAV